MGWPPSQKLTAAGNDGLMATALLPTLPKDRNDCALDHSVACAELEPMSPQERLIWARTRFGERFALTTSFGIQAAVLLHMASEMAKRFGSALPVIWVDTGYLPPETYRYAEQLSDRLELDLHVTQASCSPARMEALRGQLWNTGRLEDLELYNHIRKVEPLDQLLEELQVACWASGVRLQQTQHRQGMRHLEAVRQRWSLRPLLNWTNKDIFYYMQHHDLPQHPLFEKGYSTVGDWHSSGPDGLEVSGRATRFGGLKQECGIHLPGLMGEGI